jgi:threonine synthase|tara:strand:- start:9498 stop:10712 length:1215 start_codon:yes stop_codon:yes gene_type:complete
MELKCIGCSSTFDLDTVIYSCTNCNDLLEVVYDLDKIQNNLNSKWKDVPLSVWKYHDFLPIDKDTERITLNEGGTRLHNVVTLGSFLGIDNLYVKNEGDNPTSSFKDRGMTVSVTKARQLGAKTISCASTGNTSASLAAYGARGGLKRIVLIPSGKVAYGKLSQAMICGAQVIQVNGNFDQCLEVVMDLSKKFTDIYLVNSINPFRIEGQKTLGFEIFEQLKHIPDYIIVPVGNAGNVSAIWKGLSEFYKLGIISKLPKMIGVQAEGASPISNAFLTGKMDIKNVSKPETIATAIRIGAPASWKKALRAIYDSNGSAEIVSDKEILDAQLTLAKLEGLFIEPASATPIAALKKLLRKGVISSDDEVVCIATGHGLKDPDVITKFVEKPVEVSLDIDEIQKLVQT